ncbi:MAG: hypothetical protein JWP29_5673, partial [Rhodoferax sp.]|nr:hypothetical protein [Rhodoferax sp.]
MQSIYNYDEQTTSYNFTDQPTLTTRKHYIKNSGGTAATLMLTSSDSLTYDHIGRSREHWNRLTNGVLTAGTKTLLSQQEYNEVGQLYRKKLHSTNSGSTFYQTVLYQSNERGWLVTDSAQLFTQQLSYNTGAVPQYNGNISAQNWVTNGGAVKSANYTYDKLNRLLSGNTNDGFGERAITYDLMGNLKTLSRYQGGVLIDSLNYHYPNGGLSNQADTIRDLSGSALGAPITAMAYTYTGDGLTKRDGRNGNNIAYNQLDLPQTVTGNDNITYYYNAAGIKTAKVSVVGAITTKTDYIDGIQYTTTNTGAPVLDLIQTAEGRARLSGTSFDYQYDLTDHLGNSRVTFSASGASAALVQNNDYYPFGMVSNGFVSGTKNEYLYNKKELQEETGMYDYGARFYDPVIGRMTTVDRFAEKYMGNSPYQYGANNPILNIDMNGDSIRTVGSATAT